MVDFAETETQCPIKHTVLPNDRFQIYPRENEVPVEIYEDESSASQLPSQHEQIRLVSRVSQITMRISPKSANHPPVGAEGSPGLPNRPNLPGGGT